MSPRVEPPDLTSPVFYRAYGAYRSIADPVGEVARPPLLVTRREIAYS